MVHSLLSDNMTWIEFPGFEGFYYNVLEVDPDDRFVQLLLKFDPGVKCVAHRHVGPVKTLVLEGEHQIFDVADSELLTDCRPAGTYSTHSGDEAHVEGGGPEGAIVLLSMESVDGEIWETYNTDLTVDRVSLASDFRRGLEKQKQSPSI